MKQTRLMMGMPITIEIVDAAPEKNLTDAIAVVFDYFTYIDNKFSTYKFDSEMMKINRGEILEKDWSDDMRIIFMLAEETKQRTNGFFNIKKPNATASDAPSSITYDPSGIVKGWAIWNAAKLLAERGFRNFYLDVGGDIQTSGANAEGEPWSIGIRNPLVKSSGTEAGRAEVVKTIYAAGPLGAPGTAVATSGTYIRGEHIYNPKTGKAANETVSLTIVGPNIYEADRFATAAFAMGAAGIHFIEGLSKTAKLEGYMIDRNGVATMTTGFEKYTHAHPH